MDYFFYFYISQKHLQLRKKKYINLGNQFHYKKYKDGDINKRMFSFSIIVLNMKLLVILFIMEKKAFARGNFWFTPYK